MTGPSGRRRRQRARLWSQLVERDAIAIPSATEVLERLDRESDAPTRGWLTGVLGRARPRDAAEAGLVVDALEALFQMPATRPRAGAALGDFAATHDHDDAQVARIAGVCLRPPLDAGTIGRLGRPLARIALRDAAGAARLAERLFAALVQADSQGHGLGAAGERALVARWRKPVRDVFRRAPRPELESLLARVPELNRHLGRIIVDAACVEAFGRFRPTLTELLDHNDVHDALKVLIRGHMFLRERHADSNRWHALAALVSGPAMSRKTTTAGKHAFISYARADAIALARLRTALKNLERQGHLSAWTDCEILPGDDWNDAIASELDRADLVIFLAGPDLIASDYVYSVELARALDRQRAGATTVVPIIYRPCDWQHTELARFEALPRGGRPIATAPHPDQAWQEVTDGLRALLTTDA